jgi:hypothetical protein
MCAAREPEYLIFTTRSSECAAAAQASDGRPSYLVVNGDESEPGTCKVCVFFGGERAGRLIVADLSIWTIPGIALRSAVNLVWCGVVWCGVVWCSEKAALWVKQGKYIMRS